MPHFLNEKGDIPLEMPKEARELASFFALVIDTTTQTFPQALSPTNIRCFKKRCHGLITSEILNDDLHWKCSKCPNEGIISHWQNTKWDNRK